MRYCPKRKLAFFFPPKTGGISLSALLDDWGAKKFIDPNSFYNFHIKKSGALKLFEELCGYKSYGFFRNPTERFISAVNYLKPRLDGVSVWNYPKVHSEIFVPQSEILGDSELLDFDNYESEVKKVASLFGMNCFYVPKMNANKNKNMTLTEEARNFVMTYYAVDYEIAKSKLNKYYQI